ncbi:MAG: glutamine amidotransferase [Planctomycetaceae bacterium]
MSATLLIGDRHWLIPAVLAAVVGVLLALWQGRKNARELGVATLLRSTGWLLMCLCLINPLWSSARPRKGANVVAVVTDISRSHQVLAGKDQTVADRLRDVLNAGEQKEQNGWLQRIDQDFELHRYTVSDRLLRVDSFEDQAFEQPASNLCSALEQIGQRYAGQPLAGIVVLTDGNSTDAFTSDDSVKVLPPVYPVMVPCESGLPDVALGAITVSETAFDDAPVTLQVQTRHTGAAGKKIRLSLLDSDGASLETKTVSAGDDSPVRFEARPESAGMVFYSVKATLLDENDQPIPDEVSPVNNQRMVAVDRGSEKRRILYVSGRPNWEFKFLRRAVETDPQTELVGLIRIARKEAKFDFRGRDGERSNSLFRGFDATEQELAAEFDEPVLVRLGTEDEEELKGGFPENAEDLFEFDALILDDVEAEFFLADQLQLIYEFVARRGGGFLMMGGQESFRQGEYDHTPVGELLPIDLHQEVPAAPTPVRLSLSREGWLQPWIRLRSDENAERQRLADMPAFVTLNSADFVRPGAIVMASVHDESGTEYPALITQRFGRGRSAALCVGDFWRWRMNEGRRRLQEFAPDVRNPADIPVAPGEQPEEDLNDHARASRQLIRWLVADVPRRLDVAAVPLPSMGLGTMKLTADLKGRDFEAREDGDVSFQITRPDGTSISVAGEPDDEHPGRFETVVSAIDAGPYSAEVTARIREPEREDEVLVTSLGWASQPDQEEMKSVQPNRNLLQHLATSTGGQMVAPDDLSDFVGRLKTNEAPLVDIWSWPVWHQWWVFGTAVLCFVGDWTIRRRTGLP